MKITIEYNLPDDEFEYKMSYKGKDYYLTLSDLYDYIRTKLKYDDKISDESVRLLEEISEMIGSLDE